MGVISPVVLSEVVEECVKGVLVHELTVSEGEIRVLLE